MRFLRNNDPEDVAITHCAIPRWGYTYKKCHPDAKAAESEGSPRCAYTVDSDEDSITCDESSKHSSCYITEEGNAKCECTIPPGYYYDGGSVDKTK